MVNSWQLSFDVLQAIERNGGRRRQRSKKAKQWSSKPLLEEH
jgi:hypothetical protein